MSTFRDGGSCRVTCTARGRWSRWQAIKGPVSKSPSACSLGSVVLADGSVSQHRVEGSDA